MFFNAWTVCRKKVHKGRVCAREQALNYIWWCRKKMLVERSSESKFNVYTFLWISFVKLFWTQNCILLHQNPCRSPLMSTMCLRFYAKIYLLFILNSIILKQFIILFTFFIFQSKSSNRNEIKLTSKFA